MPPAIGPGRDFGAGTTGTGRFFMRGRGMLRGLVVAAVAMLSLAFASTASADSFIVLYKSNSVPASASAASRRQAAHTSSATTRSRGHCAPDSAGFASRLANDNASRRASTAGFASKLDPAESAEVRSRATCRTRRPLNRHVLGLQWDMRQIHTPQAHAVTGGSPAVVVGDIDTGLDYRHPDLAQNVSSPIAPTAWAAHPSRARWPPMTTTATAPIPPARSRRLRMALASSAWRRT